MLTRKRSADRKDAKTFHIKFQNMQVQNVQPRQKVELGKISVILGTKRSNQGYIYILKINSDKGQGLYLLLNNPVKNNL